jgi:hypothetical protein
MVKVSYPTVIDFLGGSHRNESYIDSLRKFSKTHTTQSDRIFFLFSYCRDELEAIQKRVCVIRVYNWDFSFYLIIYFMKHFATIKTENLLDYITCITTLTEVFSFFKFSSVHKSVQI